MERERDRLVHDLEQSKQARRTAQQLAEARLLDEVQTAAAAKESEVQPLHAQLRAAEIARPLAVAEAFGVMQKERHQLRSSLEKTPD